MLSWLKKKIPCAGTVLYPGPLPPRAENFAYLAEQGVEIVEGAQSAESHWQLELRHRSWGTAHLAAFRDLAAPPEELIQLDWHLTPEEKQEGSRGESTVSVRMLSTGENVLRDRKQLLRFLRAVMGEYGLLAMDHLSQRFWSREALEVELAHDADLDIDALLSFHAVADDDGEQLDWLHTHGLAEIGFFDFDILEPSGDLLQNAYDGLRAVAFLIVEGELGRSSARVQLAYPGGFVRTLPAGEFMRRAATDHAKLRSEPEESHLHDRVVLCDPPGRFLGRWLGKVRPNRLLSRPFDGEGMFRFSHDATDLMCERARLSLALFRRLCGELAWLELPKLVKLGYRTDGGEERDLEHLWFEVEGFHEDSLEAVLVNEPFQIERMKAGQRDRHDVERLSDWQIITPFGPINPRQTAALRILRSHADEMREVLDAARRESPGS